MLLTISVVNMPDEQSKCNISPYPKYPCSYMILSSETNVLSCIAVILKLVPVCSLLYAFWINIQHISH